MTMMMVVMLRIAAFLPLSIAQYWNDNVLESGPNVVYFRISGDEYIPNTPIILRKLTIMIDKSVLIPELFTADLTVICYKLCVIWRLQWRPCSVIRFLVLFMRCHSGSLGHCNAAFPML